MESLVKQDVENFDLILINDDIPMQELEADIGMYRRQLGDRFLLLNGKKGSKPYELRIQLLETAREKGYDLLILCDADDIFSHNRVRCICENYDEDIAFYYNEIRSIQGKSVMPDLPKTAAGFKDIGESNFLGLSNTAINIKKMTPKFLSSLYEGDTQIFDWYLFSRILINVGKGKRVDNCYTYYRIHENNLAGISECNLENVRREIAIKQEHYRQMSKYDTYFKSMYTIYMKLENRVQNLVITPHEHYWWGIIDIGKEKGAENV